MGKFEQIVAGQFEHLPGGGALRDYMVLKIYIQNQS